MSRYPIDAVTPRYEPTEWSKNYFRGEFREGFKAGLARLILMAEGEGDELDVLASVQRFAEYVARLDANLRRDLAGDWPRTDTGRSGTSEVSDRRTDTKGAGAA